MNFDAARQLLEMTDEDLSQKVDPTHHYAVSYTHLTLPTKA